MNVNNAPKYNRVVLETNPWSKMYTGVSLGGIKFIFKNCSVFFYFPHKNKFSIPTVSKQTLKSFSKNWKINLIHFM